MTEKRKLELRCPICKKEVRVGDADSPFCSERCRTIDLGNWASGAYVVPSSTGDAEERIGEGAPPGGHDEDL